MLCGRARERAVGGVCTVGGDISIGREAPRERRKEGGVKEEGRGIYLVVLLVAVLNNSTPSSAETFHSSDIVPKGLEVGPGDGCGVTRRKKRGRS